MTDEQTTGMDPVRKWTFIALGTCAVLMLFYLIGDRVTPYTSQARVNARVVPIASEVSGTVADVAVTSNQAVVAGELLFQVDPIRYALAVETALASLESARQATRASSADVNTAEGKAVSAAATLRSAWQDAVRLRRIKQEDAGAISDRRIELAESALMAAEGGLAGAKASLERAIEALGQTGDANTNVLQAQAALEQAELNLTRTAVVAPDEGVVTDVRVARGNFAQAGAPLMTFVPSRNIWIQADFTENNLGNIKRGDPVEIIFDALPGTVIKGNVRTTGFGVNVNSASLGSLPTIENDRQWLRDAQRFSVWVDFELPSAEDRMGIRVGAQASVIVYADSGWIMTTLGKIKMRLLSVLTYAY